MGQGEEVKTRSSPDVEIQERGEIYFFYRPKVNKEEAHSSDDVQRMYIVLRPESAESSTQVKQQDEKEEQVEEKQKQKQEEEEEEEEENEEAEDNPPPTEGGHGSQEVNIEKDSLLRFIVMGQKKLPDPTKKSRPLWGFVELVTTKIEEVKDALKGGEYDTAKSGHTHKAAARAVGEGIYRILRHHTGKKMHTHLIYKLEFPSEEEKHEPQEALNIEKEASFLIQIKNPTQKGQFRGLSKKKRAVFPAHLQGQFGKLRYHAADPPDFLNYEGCEFLLIAASDDIEEELGLELKGEVEETQDASCSDLLNTFGETSSANALLRGIWV